MVLLPSTTLASSAPFAANEHAVALTPIDTVKAARNIG
jgi:hypothetical protein